MNMADATLGQDAPAPTIPASVALAVTGLGKRVPLPTGELTILDDVFEGSTTLLG